MEHSPESEITAEQRRQIDAIFSNPELISFMSSGLANDGEIASDSEILARQQKAIDIMAEKGDDFWNFAR